MIKNRRLLLITATLFILALMAGGLLYQLLYQLEAHRLAVILQLTAFVLFLTGGAAGMMLNEVRLNREIQQRKRAEKGLLRYAGHFRSIMAHIPLSVSIKDAEGRYQSVNRHWCRIFAVTEAVAKGKTDHELFGKSLALQFEAQDRALMQDIKSVVREETVLPSQGPRTLLGFKFISRYSSDHGPAICAIYTDITPFRQLEYEIDRMRMLQEALLDVLPHPVAIKDLDARFVSCNKAFETTFGVTRNQIAGKSVMEVTAIPEEERLQATQEDERLLRNAATIHREVVVRLADGELHDFLYWASGHHLPHGGIGGMVCAYLDRTEQRKIEHALKVDLANWSSILEACPVAATLMRADGTFYYVNEPFASMIDSTPAKLKQAQFSDVLADAGQLGSLENALKNGDGDISDLALTLRTNGGRVCKVILCGRRVTLQGDPLLIAWYHDVSILEETRESVGGTNLTDLVAWFQDEILSPLEEDSSHQSPTPMNEKLDLRSIETELALLALYLEGLDGETINFFETIREKLSLGMQQSQIDYLNELIQAYDFDNALALLKQIRGSAD